MKKLRVGLTGGIASGKSKVSQIFDRLNIDIIDADKIARDLFKADAPLLSTLRNRFGASIFFDDGSLNRKKLGQIVFNSAEDLNWLNQLTHPEVSTEINKQLLLVKSPYVILDIPLLVNIHGDIPTHLAHFVDKILVVDVTLENQISRLCQRDSITVQQAQVIINNQSSRQQKLNHADDIIDNNGTMQALESQVTVLHNYYLSLSKKID